MVSRVLAMLAARSHVRITCVVQTLCVSWIKTENSSANPQVSPSKTFSLCFFCLETHTKTLVLFSRPMPGFDKCSMSGDPHYRTFDKFTHHFMGPYTYILTQGHNLQSNMPSLLIRGKNIRRGGNRRVSYLDEMYIDVYGVSVRFLQRKAVLVSSFLLSFHSFAIFVYLMVRVKNIRRVL